MRSAGIWLALAVILLYYVPTGIQLFNEQSQTQTNMAFKLDGKIIHIFPETSGGTAEKPWTKQFFVMEYLDGSYKKNAHMMLWNDKVEQLNGVREGDHVTVQFNVSSREYNGKWFTDLSVWKLEAVDGGRASSANPQRQFPVPDQYSNAPSDDLPF